MSTAAPPTRPPGTPFVERLSRAAADLWRRSALFDEDGADPRALCLPLHEHGLFRDALPHAEGGIDLAGGGPLREALLHLGGADLSAARIFEGHVNAVKLVFAYGDEAQRDDLAHAVRDGAVCGVWNAEVAPGLELETAAEGVTRLRGRKIYCSGLGVVDRPLVTAHTPDGLVMLMLHDLAAASTDLSGWTVRGMRATATGTVDFSGMPIGAGERIGGRDDYYRAPLFKGGAWRFAAAQTGAVLRLVRLMREDLRRKGRDGDPHQQVRLGRAEIAAQTCELWIAQAARIAQDPDQPPEAIDAYVNLARSAVEAAAMEVISLVERGIGLAAFTRPSPVERVVRDLSTYLRQPFPDGALQEAAAYASQLENGPCWSLARDFPG